MTEHGRTDPRHDLPYDMADETILSEDGVNPVSHDPERDWGKNTIDGSGFAITFPGAVPPYYFPGYPGDPRY